MDLGCVRGKLEQCPGNTKCREHKFTKNSNSTPYIQVKGQRIIYHKGIINTLHHTQAEKAMVQPRK